MRRLPYRRVITETLVFGLLLVFDARGQVRIWEEFGDAAGDQLGTVVAGVGDVNRDGAPDVVAGEFRHNNDIGRARVYSGKDGSIVYTFDGAAALEGFGDSVCGPGDLNSDGIPDIAVGGVMAGSTYSGFVRVFSGSNGALLYTITGNAADNLGVAMDAVSDCNGDGIGDLVIGSYRNYVLIASGFDGSTIRTLTGTGTPALFGQSVGRAGDVNQDGVEDDIIGDPGYSNAAGAAWVFSGSDGTILYTFYGTAFQYFGSSVGTPGDVDADGFSDVIVGAPDDSSLSSDNGAAFVYSGKDGSVLYSVFGEKQQFGNPGWKLGYSVNSAGDQNADGYADFLVGAPAYWDLGSLYGGAAFLYSGRDGGFLYHFAGTGSGNASNSEYGNALGPVGDINGDGAIDVTIADAGNDSGSLRDVGSVSLCLGGKLFLDATPKKASAGLTVTFTTAQGVAGSPEAVVLVSVNGAPTFLPFDVNVLDSSGRRQIQGLVPTGLGALTLGLRAYTLDPRGRLVVSGVEELTLE